MATLYINKLTDSSSNTCYFVDTVSGYITSSGSCAYATSAGSAPASDVYSWAKASSKPTYTYSEVGAAASSHSHSSLDIAYSNETNISNGFAGGSLYINYRGASSAITSYILGNGVSGSLGTIIHSGNIGSQSVNYATSAGSATSSSSAAKLTTARTIQTNLGSSSSASFDGSANITPGITGTLGAANGGTGKTTLGDAANALINSLSTGSSDATMSDYYVAQYAGGGTSTTTYHRRPVQQLYNCIKSNASGTWGINISGNANYATSAGSASSATTAGTCTGNAATASVATTTQKIRVSSTDYSPSLHTITIVNSGTTYTYRVFGT